uniref:Uncharacterized conserved protein, contains double-stranded beta-helix domain n=1 Tax=Loigolactobacillus rennini TaxID=238013 RepID=A0A1K2I9A8_9LACO|nr:Uncharacterized conserved protein, contains double-stranded beta-helix domain [Loigolactobacillus rennini]
MNLRAAIHYHDQQITSRSLSKKFGVAEPLTLFAYAKNESVSKEICPNVKLIQVLEGQLKVSTTTNQTLHPNDLITILPKQAHGLVALTDCKFLQLELQQASTKK